MIVHIILGYCEPDYIRFYNDDPPALRGLGLRWPPTTSTMSRRLGAVDKE